MSDLDGAFADSHALYALTDCWDPALRGSTDAEFKQGKGIVDCAVKANVHIVIYSGAPEVDESLPCPGCDGAFFLTSLARFPLNHARQNLGKTLVTAYCMQQPFNFVGINIGWYMMK